MAEPQHPTEIAPAASWFLGLALFVACATLMASTGLATGVSVVWMVLDAIG